MSMLGIAVVKETAPGERRVALDPDGVKRLVAAGVEVLVQSGCGQGAWFSDADYTEAGARVVDEKGLFEEADVVLSLSPPSSQAMESLREGQSFVGLLAPLTNPDLMERLAQRGVTAVSLDGLPRTLSRAQTMDALSSQANIAGYKAALVGATAFGRFFPLLSLFTFSMLGLVVAVLSQGEQIFLENILHGSGPGSRLARRLKTAWAKDNPIAVLRLLQIPAPGRR